jgi:enamine deaminase RidA (YjgF/YER057c/UK114 family)
MTDPLVTPRGRFPHARAAGDLIYVSGTSSRRPDNSIAGAASDEMGTTSLDIRVQTRAVLENIRAILRRHGVDLGDLVQVTTYLVSLAVHQLPHPHLLIEIQAVAHRR